MIDPRLNSSATEEQTNENFNRVLKYIDAIAKGAKVSVTFDSDGGSDVASQLIPLGSKATEPVDPTKEDYEFAGWMLGDEIFDFDTEVTEDITLTAAWEAVGE